jgi:hypothetical protein
MQVADSLLFQWFTHSSFIDGVRPVSKSTLERFEKIFPADELATLIHELTSAVADKATASELLYRETAVSFDEIFADDYDVHVHANGYFDHHSAAVTVQVGANLFDYALDPSGMPSGFFLRDKTPCCFLYIS